MELETHGKFSAISHSHSIISAVGESWAMLTRLFDDPEKKFVFLFTQCKFIAWNLANDLRSSLFISLHLTFVSPDHFTFAIAPTTPVLCELTHQINPIWLVSIRLPATCLTSLSLFDEIPPLLSSSSSLQAAKSRAREKRRSRWKFSPLHHFQLCEKLTQMMMNGKNSYPRIRWWWLRVGNLRRSDGTHDRVCSLYHVAVNVLMNGIEIESYSHRVFISLWNDFISSVVARQVKERNISIFTTLISPHASTRSE